MLGFKCTITILETNIQQGMEFKEISRTLGNQKAIDLLSYEQLLSIIIKEIRIFLQNVYKNNLLTNTILESQRDFDIIFIQEPLWSFIWSIPFLSSNEGEKLVKVINYSN